jgi:ABC-type Mn2+/Zn2+ transport system ATPase subunit
VKLEFRNLGTIAKTTLDLRPLTVIIGPNNTSKTYLAYCVHGLLSSLADALSQLHAAPDRVGNVNQLIRKVTRRFASKLPEYFQDTYGGLFRETTLGLLLDENEAGAIPELLRQHALTLPAERNALVITYKVLSARRYRVLRDFQRQISLPLRKEGARAARERALVWEQGDIRYPAPIEDFLDFLTDVELRAARPLNGASSPFGKLAGVIEKHIQSGHRTRYEPTPFGGHELALTVNDRLRLDLYNASSSIKQLAPLLLYLRYRAAENQVLIIDEPEMNLHPEGQAKLLEVLAMLANLGVYVLLTTHSADIMAHLNSVIAADPKSVARRKRQARHLYTGESAAFLSPDRVNAYEMRSEGLVSLADPEYGIRWDTLSDVSSEIQRRYFAIVEEPRGRAKAK